MDGQATMLLDYMEGIKKHFSIPVYQRNYDWSKENCNQLFNDLLKVIKGNRPRHFFGSIVSVYSKPLGKRAEYLIIDGQQRITTVSLLLLAINNLLKDRTIKSEADNLQEMIWTEYLTIKYSKGNEPLLKLKSIKNDQEAFERLFKGDEKNYINSSNITENYKNFHKWIQEKISREPLEGEISIDQLFEAIGKLEIIDIELESDDNPQLIFESLNSTGLTLTEGDKIRNFILMDLPIEEQNDYYEKYWNQIENCTKTEARKYDVTPFIRDYLSLQNGQIPDQKDVYALFKELVAEKYADADDKKGKELLLADLLAYAEQYEFLLKGKTKQFKVPIELKKCIRRLNHLGTSVTRPFFLEVLMLHKKGDLTIKDVTKIFQIIESYLFRRLACDLPTSVINSIFVQLHKEIMKYDKTSNKYVEKLIYTLSSRRDRGIFPMDQEFAKGFTERFAYRNKTAVYILERLENYDTREGMDVYGNSDADNKDLYSDSNGNPYSVEHIMPQTLNKEWREDLMAAGDDPDQVHDKWLHRIANLTLVAKEYNSKYSNHRFLKKRDMKNGLATSGFRLNSLYIGKLDKWTSKELEDRAKYLAKEALDIWPRPTTDFVPPKPVLEFCNLNDVEDLINRKFYSFKFRNGEERNISKTSAIKGWKEMFQEMIEILYKENNSILRQLAESSEKGIASRFYTENEGDKKLYNIDSDLYVSIPGNNLDKIELLQELFERYGIPFTDLVFYFEPINDSAEFGEE